VQGITVTEGGGGAEIGKIIFYFTMLWFLHWFIPRSGVKLVLWMEVEACEFAYWILVVDIYISLFNRGELH
jgi:hypothetical protein